MFLCIVAVLKYLQLCIHNAECICFPEDLLPTLDTKFFQTKRTRVDMWSPTFHRTPGEIEENITWRTSTELSKRYAIDLLYTNAFVILVCIRSYILAQVL